MTHQEAPGYYCVTGTPNYLPAAEEFVEGRLFIDGDQLVCGAGEMRGGGYAETLDTYSESTVRRLFGNRFDPQEFRLEVAFDRQATLVVPLSAVSSADLQRWDGSQLRGADETFAVCVRAPSVLYDPVLIQLGRGGRNRGAGRTRHASLAAWLDAFGADMSSAPATEANGEPVEAAGTDRRTVQATEASSESVAATESNGGPDESTASPDPAEAEDASGANGPAADSGPSSSNTQPPDAATDAQPSDTPAGTEDPGLEPSNATSGADTEPDDAGADTDPEPTWLDAEPDTPALIVKNRSDIRLQPRIRGRHRNDVIFLDDVDLAPGETHRWTEFPQRGLVHLDILFDDGSRRAEQLDERHLQSPPVGIDLYASGIEIHSGH